MLKRILAGVILAVMLTGGAAAEPFQEAVTAYQRGDYATALRLWRLLAEQGDASAQYNLGVMYITGQGVPQDYAEAVKWLRLAAEQAISYAQDRLGIIYRDGQGVQPDYVQALMWFTLAAAECDAANHRDLMTSKMTPAQIAEAQKLAREWKPKSPTDR